MLRHLSHLIVAQCGAKLVSVNRHVRAVAKPGLDLLIKSSLLELGNEPLEITEVRFAQDRREEGRDCGCFELSQNATE